MALIPCATYLYTLAACLLACCLLPAVLATAGEAWEQALLQQGCREKEQQAWVAIAFWLRSCFSELLLPTAALQWLVYCGF